MCLIVALSQVNPRYPLIVAANREEARRRPSTPPYRWPGEPALWAGRDEVAGGTWLGANSKGLVAAITNRRDAPVDPSLPSRGRLCLKALRQASPGHALAAVSSELKAHRSNPFNLLCANPAEGWVTTWRGETRALDPGTHILTNWGDIDDPRLARIRRARSLLARIELATPDLPSLLRELAALCADTRGRTPLCKAIGDRGTVSSSLIALDGHGEIAAYWHAEGPPCEAPYQPVDLRRALG